MTYIRAKSTEVVYAPTGWDKGYRRAQAALAASGTPIRVWLHGHSIMTGHYATDVSTEAFRWLVRNHLVNKFGRSADYFSVTLSASAGDFGNAGTFVWNGGTPPWVMGTGAGGTPLNYAIGASLRFGNLGGTTTLVPIAYSGMGGAATWLNPGAGVTLGTFTHRSWLETAQAYDLVVPNFTAGTSLAYNVNGAGATNVTLTADGRVQVIQMATGLAAGRVNTVITGVGATGQPWLDGVTAHATTRGAAGVQVAHIAANGSSVGNMDINYMSNTLLGKDAATGTVGAGAFPLCPDLIVCDFPMADSSIFSPDVTVSRYAQYIEAVRRAKADCSIIFAADYRPNGITTDGAAFDQYALGYPASIETVNAVAQQYCCAVVNVNEAWQGRAQALGYIATSGEIHPTTAGHANYASLITPLL